MTFVYWFQILLIPVTYDSNSTAALIALGETEQ